MIGKMCLKENNFISRADTRLLKGVAIILLLTYHFFVFQNGILMELVIHILPY